MRELARRELARRNLLDFILYNFPEYKINWHHRVLAQKLEAVERGEIKRLMVFMPPRHGKSELCSIQFPAWLVGRDKDRDIILASYSAELAHDFGRQTRNLIAAQEYKNIFTTTLSEDSQAKGKWNTDGRGAYNAVGVGGSVTGRGADCLILDDPIKNRQDADSIVIRDGVWNWYKSTARTRLSPEGAIILINTRWHLDDLAGRLLKQGADEWEVVNFPAIAVRDEEHRKAGEALWADHFTLENLEKTKKDIGIYEWSSLFQQAPILNENQEFRPHWILRRSRDEVLKRDTRRFLTIDTAVSQRESADYTGIVKNYVDSENKWNISSFRKRMSPMDVIEFLFSSYEQERFEKIGIEKTVYLLTLKPFLDEEMRKRNIFLPIVELLHNQTQKETRIRGLIPRYESRSIIHIEEETADLEEEMFSFPKGLHDDILDALAYMSQIAERPDNPYESTRIMENRLARKTNDFGL